MQSATLVIAAFHDADRTTTAGQFTTLIDWADASTSAGTVESDGSGGFVVKGSHAYARTGRYTARVTISDGAGHSAQAIGSVNVKGAA